MRPQEARRNVMTVQSRTGQMDNTIARHTPEQTRPETAPGQLQTEPIAAISAHRRACRRDLRPAMPGRTSGLSGAFRFLPSSARAPRPSSPSARPFRSWRYFVFYTAAVTFAFPAASVLTIFAGFVFRMVGRRNPDGSSPRRSAPRRSSWPPDRAFWRRAAPALGSVFRRQTR